MSEQALLVRYFERAVDQHGRLHSSDAAFASSSHLLQMSRLLSMEFLAEAQQTFERMWTRSLDNLQRSGTHTPMQRRRTLVPM